ncbi:MAG: hypothetical protein N2235_08615 [Fischerella sp.]|nr:hypothetical protein [Fischerella sp.]
MAEYFFLEIFHAGKLILSTGKVQKSGVAYLQDEFIVENSILGVLAT